MENTLINKTCREADIARLAGQTTVDHRRSAICLPFSQVEMERSATTARRAARRHSISRSRGHGFPSLAKQRRNTTARTCRRQISNDIIIRHTTRLQKTLRDAIKHSVTRDLHAPRCEIHAPIRPRTACCFRKSLDRSY